MSAAVEKERATHALPPSLPPLNPFLPNARSCERHVAFLPRRIPDLDLNVAAFDLCGLEPIFDADLKHLHEEKG